MIFPIFSTSHSTISPSFRNSGGVLANPTPLGVPVAIISPVTLISMEKLINMGINHESKQLGALYILIALTIVSTDAAAALPWLHESVR